MRQRVLSALVLVPLVLLAIWIGGLPLLTLVGLAALLGIWELYSMAGQAGHRPWWPLGMALALFFVLEPSLPSGLFTSGLFAAVVLSLLWLFLRPHDLERAVTDWALTLAGALYVGLLRFAVLIAYLPNSSLWLLLALLATWSSDTAAYLVGRARGQHLLLPRVSPAKTWEGTLAGLVAPALAVAVLAGPLAIPGLHIVPLGVVAGAAAVAGDLAESALKRGFGAKASGGLIPGHGGVLDRFDSLLMVLVLVYWYAVGIADVGNS